MEKGRHHHQSRTKRRATVEEIGRPKGWGARHTFTLMCFLSYALCFSVRVDLAVAIVAMVDTSAVLNNGSSLSPCHEPDAEFKEADQGTYIRTQVLLSEV